MTAVYRADHAGDTVRQQRSHLLGRRHGQPRNLPTTRALFQARSFLSGTNPSIRHESLLPGTNLPITSLPVEMANAGRGVVPGGPGAQNECTITGQCTLWVHEPPAAEPEPSAHCSPSADRGPCVPDLSTFSSGGGWRIGAPSAHCSPSAVREPSRRFPPATAAGSGRPTSHCSPSADRGPCVPDLSTFSAGGVRGRNNQRVRTGASSGAGGGDP